MRTLFGPKLYFDWKIVTITVVSTLLLVVDRYQQITSYKYFDRLIFYLFVPLVFILFVFRETPREYGITLGDWKAGSAITLAGIALMTPVIWYLGKYNSSMANYYNCL